MRMIEHGADVDARDAIFGNPVVIWACTGLTADHGDPSRNRYEDRMAIVEQLAARGADLDARNGDGETALHAAKYYANSLRLCFALVRTPW